MWSRLPRSPVKHSSGTLFARVSAEVPRGELVARLQGILAERDSDRVFVRADGSLPYERVARVMGALTAAGISNISLVTDSGGPGLDEADG
mgnify:CR=1 FL=1